MITTPTTGARRRAAADTEEIDLAGRTRTLLGVAMAIATLYAAARFVIVAAQGRMAFVNAYEDDAYYYLKIAENIAAGHGSTFGGMVPTNGYHPLWQLILAAAASVFPPGSLPMVAYGLQALLFVATCAALLAVAYRLRAPLVGIVSLFGTILVAYRYGDWAFSGMENSLLLPLLVGFLLVFLWPAASASALWSRAVPAALASLAVLARIDSALVVGAALLVGLIAAADRKRELRRVLWVGAPVAITVAVYAAVNEVLFGSPLPVSGQAKAIGGGGQVAARVADFMSYWTFAGVGLGILFCAGTVLALLALRGSPRLFGENGDQFLRRAIWAIAAGQIMQLVYFSVTSSWRWWPWYYYCVGIQLFLVSIVVLRRVTTRAPSGKTWVRVSAVLSMAFAVAVSAAGAYRLVGIGDEVSVHNDSTIVADWVSRNIPPSTVVAMGDRAGVFGWAVPNPVVQLEGLTEDAAYLDVMRSQSVTDEMRRRGVGVYVRWEKRPAAGRGNCQLFPEPANGDGPKSTVQTCSEDLLFDHTSSDGSEFTVWRFPLS